MSSGRTLSMNERGGLWVLEDNTIEMLKGTGSRVWNI
jgi:hypothetical protein